MTDARERMRMQPGLFAAAECACIYWLTDGFCTPRNIASCKCWDNAEAVMKATGLSAQGAGWIFRNLTRIEQEAKP
jgi:hypothetical protein